LNSPRTPPIRKGSERQIAKCVLDQFDVDEIGTPACRCEPSEFRRGLVLGDDGHQGAGARLPDVAVSIVVAALRICVTSGLMHCSNSVQFDHLVGADEQCWRRDQAP